MMSSSGGLAGGWVGIWFAHDRTTAAVNHRSGSSSGGLWGDDARQVVRDPSITIPDPLHLITEFFRPDTCRALYFRAPLDWHRASPNPLRHGHLDDAEARCERGSSTSDCDGFV